MRRLRREGGWRVDVWSRHVGACEGARAFAGCSVRSLARHSRRARALGTLATKDWRCEDALKLCCVVGSRHGSRGGDRGGRKPSPTRGWHRSEVERGMLVLALTARAVLPAGCTKSRTHCKVGE
eukprot:3526018-Prymnesium_polylepis.1